MRFEIPAAIKAEHEALHTRLEEATREPGAVGETAREVARLLHPHFQREEDYALPPLGLLAEITKHGVTGEMLVGKLVEHRLGGPHVIDPALGHAA